MFYIIFVFTVTDIRGRSMLHVPKSGSSAEVLLVTDGLDEGLTGTLVYCVKADANKEIKIRMIADVCYWICQCHV